MINESGQNTSADNAQHYECRTPLAGADTSLAGSGIERNGNGPDGTDCSATVSAKNIGAAHLEVLAFHALKQWCYRHYKKALRSGRLTPGPCFAAGEQCTGKRINGHHHDYRQPLDVVWSCDGHHAAIDKLRRDGHSLASAMVQLLIPSAAPAAGPLWKTVGSGQ
jgi:hypothetical protein